MSWPHLMLLALICLMTMLSLVAGSKRNYDAKYSNLNIPQWKQRACEKPKQNKANAHYICDDKGDVKCMPGWQGDLCQVPMCRRGCDPMNGYCQRPGECRCRIGYTGEHCEKCMTLPGCQHGTCNKPFECLCKPGWDGLFCTEPTCRQDCHSTRGYCEAPGECRCRIGWSGRTCSDCAVLPGCQHGTCKKPLDCQCLPGYTGLLCQTPICKSDCSKQHGYCRKPEECRCKVGWQGPRCDACHPYPGCVNGDCEQPWACNCRPGWGGMLCDEKLTFCEENPNTCENAGKCISLTKGDGQYRCHCRQGYLGKNCEIVDEYLMTSTAAPRITPPHGNDYNYEETTTSATTTKIIDTHTTVTTLKETATSIGNNVSTTTLRTVEKPTADYLNKTDAELKREGVADPAINKATATTTATITPPTKATHVLSLLRPNGAQKKFAPVVTAGARYPDEPLIFPTMTTEKTTPTTATKTTATTTATTIITTTTTPILTTAATAVEKNVTLITATLQPNKVNLTKLTTSVPASASGLVGNAMRLNEPNRKGVDNDVANVIAVAGTGFKQEVVQTVNENDADSGDNEGDSDDDEDGDDDDNNDDDDDDDDDEEEDEDEEDDDDEEDNVDQFIPNLFNNEA